MSSTLSSLSVERQRTWQGKSFLTIDVDWAHDEIIADAIEIVEAYEVPTTWFVTHDTPLLKRLRANPNFELGIHPNFNYLLQGDGRNGRNAAEVVDRLLSIVPEAKSLRSHSTTQSSVLLDLFASRGLTHECNSFIPWQSGMVLKPWRLWTGLTRVPYFWEDDVSCLAGGSQTWEVESLVRPDGVNVFDFHPIHVYLNTEEMQRYESSRELHGRPEELLSHRFDGDGTRTRFIEVLRLMSPNARTSS